MAVIKCERGFGKLISFKLGFAKIRPILLGTERYFPYQDEDEESELPVHPEEEQVGKDINRSFVSYPRGEFAFL